MDQRTPIEQGAFRVADAARDLSQVNHEVCQALSRPEALRQAAPAAINSRWQMVPEALRQRHVAAEEALGAALRELCAACPPTRSGS